MTFIPGVLPFRVVERLVGFFSSVIRGGTGWRGVLDSELKCCDAFAGPLHNHFFFVLLSTVHFLTRVLIPKVPTAPVITSL